MPLNDIQIEGWDKESKFVLSEMRRMSDGIDKLNVNVSSEMTSMKVEIATIKVKVALYAALVAAVSSIILSAVISYIMKK